MSNRGYEDLLDRARERIPKDISERSRWTMPQPDIMIEGSQTILRNFSEIVDAMDRDANHVFQYLLNLNLVLIYLQKLKDVKSLHDPHHFWKICYIFDRNYIYSIFFNYF